MSFNLEPLPYPLEALEPYITKRTLEFHYTKHHQGYVNKLNYLLKGSHLEDKSLEHIIRKSSGPLFNNAAQVWNHTFYWESLTPGQGMQPGRRLTSLIDKAFGSLEEFREKFLNSAAALFGSGWCWLIQRTDGNLQIMQTSNAETPITMDLNPLLTCDVWEHAYYLDYQNRRPEYLDSYWKVINWQKVADRMK